MPRRPAGRGGQPAGRLSHVDEAGRVRMVDLIPLCHPLPLSHVELQLTPVARGYEVEATARTTAATGVEMEALTAVAVAALTVYDMVKALDRSMVIGDIRLISKRGGRSGDWKRP